MRAVAGSTQLIIQWWRSLGWQRQRSDRRVVRASSRVRLLANDSGEIASVRICIELQRRRPHILQAAFAWLATRHIRLVRSCLWVVIHSVICSVRWDQDGRRREFIGRPLTQKLDRVQYSESIPNANNAHFLESHLIEFEKNISPNVVRFEGLAVAVALYVCQPSCNIVVGPSAQESQIGHPCWGLGGDIWLVFEGLQGFRVGEVHEGAWC